VRCGLEPANGGERAAVPAAAMAYGEGMGRLILILLAVFVALMLVSALVSAIHFLFWIALLALIVVGVFRLATGVRRRSRR
jgi:uncharacterized membrane protein